MPKLSRSYSQYTREAVSLLGSMIRAARKEQRLSERELAERAGISRGLLGRIEKGDPRCEIGAAFEVATLVGVKLFDADETSLVSHLRHTTEKLALLPKSARKKSRTIHDDF